MQRKTFAALLAAIAATGPVAAATVDRAPYQAAIAKQFPGFEILRREQFQSGWREAVRDGENGALIVGRFNFDAYPDFVAYLVRIGTPASGRFSGLRVECLGAPASQYKCSSREMPLYLPYEGNLEIVQAGAHKCMNDADDPEWITVRAEIDSIGEYSEKGGGFAIRRKDGTEFMCVTSD